MSRPALRTQQLCFSHSDALSILEDVTFTLRPGWTGLVGANGAGKSTLLRLLAGELRPSSGSVRVEPEGARVVHCAQGVEVLSTAVQELAERLDAEAFTLRGRLDLEPARLGSWAQLSPGERKRWQIAAALASEPDVLLLDEPTNHLDSAARTLLVGALRRFRGVGVVVSHDRELLEALTRETLRAEAGGVRLWPGSYGAARELWQAERDRTVAQHQAAKGEAERRARLLDEARREQEAAVRQRSTGRRMKNRHDSDARSLMADYRSARAEAHLGARVGALRRLAEAEQVPAFEPERTVGRSLFVSFERPPQPLLASLDLAELRVGERRLLGRVRLDLRRDDRIALVGPNGAGKTTLLTALLGALRIPPERVLHLPQELSEAQAADELARVRTLDVETRGRILSLVAALGVDPARLLDSEQPSPGEARKLLLARGLGQHAWLLVLDEPTNHLDLPAIERLEEALAAYPGALVVVSHDEPFLARLTTRRWRLAEGEVHAG